MKWVSALRRRQPAIVFPRWLMISGVAIMLVAVALAPLQLAPYANTQLSLIGCYIVVGLGLNLLTGLTGLISMGQGAFFALGAYTAAILAERFDTPYLLAFPVAAVLGWLAGFAFGLPALRLSPLALALVTLALALVTPTVIKRFDEYTQGSRGMVVEIADPPPWVGIERDQWVFYLCAAVVIVAYIACRLMARGRTGRMLIAIRDNEPIASTLGIRASVVKSDVFATSAALAAVAGVLYCYVFEFVGATAFSLDMAIAFLTMIVIGGLGSNVGVVLGAVFVVMVPEWTSEISDAAPGIAYGIALIVFMFVLPYGLVGLGRSIAAALRRRSLRPPGALLDDPVQLLEGTVPEEPSTPACGVLDRPEEAKKGSPS